MPRGRRTRRTGRAATGRPYATNRRNASVPAVTIANVDMLWNSNQESNQTSEFEASNYLVLRRGNTFEFILQVSSIDAGFKDDKVTIELRRGHRARYSNGSKFQGVCGSQSRHHHQWKMNVIGSSNNQIKYRVQIPPDAPVGSYQLHVRVPLGRNKRDIIWEEKKKVVILFNPWCKDDEVYLESSDKRNEYILNETGLIWAGTHLNTFTWPWNFAQFESVSLEAVLYMLDFWDLGSDGRRSPVQVSRCLANMVNSNDSDGGILVGLWSSNEEDYADGNDPTSWSGSEAILRQYLDTRRPVRYAQCWVFGGTLTSTLRTIGIPSRPVTNFESAHDGDSNRAIDYYYDSDYNSLPDKSGDSIWNYHVWVEAWMRRPDLEGRYGGWQALDATPQEISPHSRTMVVGPASIQAVKDGKDFKYDNEFVIAEVNADIKHYIEKPDGTLRLYSSEIKAIGKHISTKAVGKMEREDITNHYKYPEGSAAERAALLGTNDEGRSQEAVQFEARLTSSCNIGDDLSFEVTGKAASMIPSGIKVTAIFEVVMYTGVVGKEVGKSTVTTYVTAAGEEKAAVFKLHAKDYLKHLKGQPVISATFLAYVSSPEQAWIKKLPVCLTLPKLNININGKGNDVELPGGRPASATVTFRNPLPKPISNLRYHVEGTGLIAPTVSKANNISAGSNSTVKLSLTPRPKVSVAERNHLTLIITAESDQLKGVMGTASVKII